MKTRFTIKKILTLPSRVSVLGSLFVVCGLLIIVRLYFVQVVYGDFYRARAVGQYVGSSSESLNRGSIYFTSRDGQNISAAVQHSGWRLAIKPHDLESATSTYKALSAVITLDRDRFFESASKESDPYEEVAFRIDNAQAEKIRDKKLSGIILVQDAWRFYPAGILAANVLGFVGIITDKREGVYGLEKSWQDTLFDPTEHVAVNPFAELFSNAQEILSFNPSAHHGNIVTTLEPSVQMKVEDVLDDVMKKYSPKGSGAIIMNPKTGAIIAMGSRPSFNPNEYNTVENPADFQNLLVEGRYEMGSIMKPLTVAKGIDEAVITPDSKYKDTGCRDIKDKTICNFDHKARGIVSMREVLRQSLNLGSAHISELIGPEKFSAYLHDLSLAEKTGIDLPNEVTGTLGDVDSASGPPVAFATAAYGQGFATSPIEMVRALAILANGGRLPTPHVVSNIRFDNGVSRSVAPSIIGGQIISTSSAETVTEMLIDVFDNALLKGVLKQEHYAIAAKTGTAQVPNPHGGGYLDNTYLHSFFGYFPARDPQFIVFLFATEPHGEEYASATLARPFLEIAQFLIHYYNIPPDR